MRNHVRHSRSVRTSPALGAGYEGELVLAPAGPGAEEAEAAEDTAAAYADEDTEAEDDLGDVVRLACPDCGRPIAVLGDELSLPEHALCPTPWNPFGLTVCTGSGRAVAEAGPLEPLELVAAEPGPVALPELPAGLDWRTQPFSHMGGPGSHPVRLPLPRTPRRLAA